MTDFLLRALIGGLGLAVVIGPFGCLIIWQKMVYFGATLSHAALLGIALGLLFQVDLQLAVILVSSLVSVLLLMMSSMKQINTDTALGILAHTMLALGLVVVLMMPATRVDLFVYLFGDILTIGWYDIAWIYAGGAITLLLLSRIWQPLLLLIMQPELAQVDGINQTKTRFLFLLLLSIIVAISIQLVGVLLIVSLLIIPSAAARRFARSPEMMVMIASLIGAISVFLGLMLSLFADTPSGPSIVIASASLFLLSIVLTSR